MRKTAMLPVFFILLASVLYIFNACGDKNSENEHESDKVIESEEIFLPEKNNGNIKAIWLSQFDMSGVFLEKGRQREITDFRNKVSGIMKHIKENGFDTVFFQIRPYGDSFYPSKIFPPSSFVTGKYGTDFEYDPVSIVTEEARKEGLSIHAWVNPYRCMTSSEIENVPDSYKVKQWYSDPETKGRLVFEYGGRIYLSPAYHETRGLIVDGIKEILSLYRFDGIHFDDYFYPSSDPSVDLDAYETYRTYGGTSDLASFRREEVNKLIKEVYKTVKEKDPSLLFGISPAGIPSNSYDRLYADVYSWGKEDGYADYLAPQIYFGFEHQNYPFDRLCDQWEQIVTNKNVSLIFGLAFVKAYKGYDDYAGSGKNEWIEHNDILYRSLLYTEQIGKCSGVAVFSYQHYFIPGTDVEVTETKAERDAFTPALIEAKWQSVFFELS